MYSLAWFITFALLLFVELATQNLVSIWFVLGTLAALGVSYLTGSLLIQILVFIVVSIIALIITRFLVNSFKDYDNTPTNSDRVIGKIGEVTKDIKKNQYGQVKVFGEYWPAFSDHSIETGTKVRVLGIDGTKLEVEEEN